MKNILVAVFVLLIVSTEAQQKIFVEGSAPDFYIAHTIGKGETLLKIGSLYNVSPVRVAGYNSVSLSINPEVGNTLKIPLSRQNFDQAGEPGTYVVLVPLYHASTSIETLQFISGKYNNMPVDLLKKLNNISSDEVAAGDNIIVGFIRVKKELAGNFIPTEKPKEKEKQTETSPTATTKPTIEEPPNSEMDKYDSDELFQMARKAAFDNKNYPLAITYLKRGLTKSPDYADLHIFLGRIYTWTDKLDSARSHFDYVIQHDSTYADAYVAYADLEYWNDRSIVALNLVNKGLLTHPQSKDLLIRKAKILRSLNRNKEAKDVIDQLLKIDPTNTEARAFTAKTKEGFSDKIGISYDYTHFDKQFKDPWHIASLEYSKQTGIGTMGVRLNYANRFKRSGLQYEFEGYPNISKRLYSFVNFAYSDDAGIFPKYRGGFSLYSSLPKSFEGEVGFRYLKFTDETWIYTAALGKYYKSWLFNARTYLTPGSTKISQSYNVGARYYYGGAYDFIGLVLGTGISPDERPSALLLNSDYKLVTQKASGTCKREIYKRHIITLSASWINTEYLPKTKGNQFEGGLSYQLRL